MNKFDIPIEQREADEEAEEKRRELLPSNERSVRTIAERLTELEQDLIALAHCCNLDGQHNEAAKVQGLLIQLQTLDIQCADVAAWPPLVNIASDGTTSWECVPESRDG